MPRRSGPRWLGPRAVAFAAPVLLLLVGTGCQVTLVAGIDARADGSGVVRAAIGLDGEALRQLGDPRRELRLDDLRQAGWELGGPREEGDGLTWIRASKPFANVVQAGEVTAELSGAEGPFRDFRLQRSRSFLKTRTSFSGMVDLSRGLVGLNDPGLQEKLGDAELGLDPGRLGGRVRVRVEAQLPGQAQTWEPPLGEQVRLETSSEVWNLQPLLPAAGALLFGASAVVLLLRRR